MKHKHLQMANNNKLAVKPSDADVLQRDIAKAFMCSPQASNYHEKIGEGESHCWHA